MPHGAESYCSPVIEALCQHADEGRSAESVRDLAECEVTDPQLQLVLVEGADSKSGSITAT